MTTRAVVVDDEPLARARLKRLLTNEGIEVVSLGSNGQEAIDLTANGRADILFIDINMPIKNGLLAAQEISLMDKPPAIVFCTAYDEYAIAAFKTNAVAYLLKPIQATDIHEAINRAARLNRFQINKLLDQRDIVNSLAVHYKGALQNTPSSDFVCFRSVDKHVFATLDNGDEILVNKTLKQLEEHLGDEFIRIHRAALVNKQQVLKLIKGDDGHVSLVLRSVDVKLPVSRRHLSEVKQCFK